MFFPGLRRFTVGSLALVGGALPHCAAAQAPAADAAQTAVEKTDPTEPERVELVTADGVLLAATYYPADEAGRDTPVVVMLADQGESPVVFDRLATRLQMPMPSEEREAIALTP